MLEIESKSRDRVYKVKTFGTLQDKRLTINDQIIPIIANVNQGFLYTISASIPSPGYS